LRFSASTPLRRVGAKLSLVVATEPKSNPGVARPRTLARPAAVSSRELAIDASRGAAMLLVCLSHFADGYLFPSGAMGLGKVIKEICVSATPTFVLLSGLMVGYLHAKNPAGFSVVRAKLVDRGLFLLSICHLLIVLCTSALFGGLTGSCKIFFVTDMLGVALIAIPPLVQRWSTQRRALTGILVFCASSLLSNVWHPHPGSFNALTEILFGQSADDGTRVLLYTFPIVPWLAIYLTASALGGYMARVLGEGRHRDAARRFAMAGVAGLALAADMFLLRRLFDGNPPHAIHQLTSPMVKTPPSPAFICFNLGIGLLVLSAALAASVHRRGAVVVRALSLIGQASLFVFVLEYFVYDFVLFQMHPRYTPAWPFMFVLSLGIIWPLAALWAKRGYNRLLTVGYGRVAEAPLPRTSLAKQTAS
jgi:uncharacterized membrane protein